MKMLTSIVVCPEGSEKLLSLLDEFKCLNKEQVVMFLMQTDETFNRKRCEVIINKLKKAEVIIEKNNYIFSFDFENEKCYFKEENANFFICDSCKHIETVPEFSNEETEKEKSELKKRGFSLLSHLSIFKGK